MIQVLPSKHSFFTFDQCRWIRPPTHLSTLDGICSSFLQQLDGLVVIQRPAPAHHVTQELHAVQLPICVLRPRVINQTNLHRHTIHNVRKCHNRTERRHLEKTTIRRMCHMYLVLKIVKGLDVFCVELQRRHRAQAMEVLVFIPVFPRDGFWRTA